MVKAETNFQCGEQIVGLKYIPKKLILRERNEKRTTIQAHWAGQLQDGQEHLLNSDWVESFILESIQDHINSSVFQQGLIETLLDLRNPYQVDGSHLQDQKSSINKEK